MLPSRAHAAALGAVLAVALPLGLPHSTHPTLRLAARPAVQPSAVAAPSIARTAKPRLRPAEHRTSRSHRRSQPTPARKAKRVLRVARSLRGHPYVWGAAGPRAFDCSGYVQFVFRRALGRHLPKYTDTQYARLRHIGRGALRPGDLVFVGSRHHHKWHVGIYAGRGRWWDAPHTGSHVQKQRIWGAAHSYARVIRR